MRSTGGGISSIVTVAGLHGGCPANGIAGSHIKYVLAEKARATSP